MYRHIYFTEEVVWSHQNVNSDMGDEMINHFHFSLLFSCISYMSIKSYIIGVILKFRLCLDPFVFLIL